MRTNVNSLHLNTQDEGTNAKRSKRWKRPTLSNDINNSTESRLSKPSTQYVWQGAARKGEFTEFNAPPKFTELASLDISDQFLPFATRDKQLLNDSNIESIITFWKERCSIFSISAHDRNSITIPQFTLNHQLYLKLVPPTNQILRSICKSLKKSHVALCHATAARDLQYALEGGCIYIPNFFCHNKDFTLFDNLKQDLIDNPPDISKDDIKCSKLFPTLDKASQSLSIYNTSKFKIAESTTFNSPNADCSPGSSTSNSKNSQLVAWSKHQKHENPQFSSLFQAIIQQLELYFDFDIFASRLNYYRDGVDWKPFHQDSHAYCKDRDEVEDFTVGASFGSTRNLVFRHEASHQSFSFPQNNGDLFAFTAAVNKVFQHGIPKEPRKDCTERISIIAWGKRKTLNSRNAGSSELSNCSD